MTDFPLAGNGHIKSSVMSFLHEKRMPHAILIEGDPGTGRHTLARFLASAAVCSGPDVPCGNCRGCRMAASFNHPDIKITAADSGKKNITVGQIRALKTDTAVKPHMAAANVFIIDSADTMNEQSQNALLKVLEEPPQNTYFILIAQNKASFLQTVISRCIILSLSVPETSAAAEYLSKNTGYSSREIAEALEAQKNNIAGALLFLEGKSDSEISVSAKEFLRCMQANDMWGMLKAAAPAEKNRSDADLFFKELKIKTVSLIRENLNSDRAAALAAFYRELLSLEKSLITNINLSLLICTLVSRASQL